MPSPKVQQCVISLVASLCLFYTTLDTNTNTDAEPDVRRADRGAGLPRGDGHPHPRFGEERGGAQGGF